MVSAGVIPIDRLIDVHAPVQVVADKLGYKRLEQTYGITLPRTKGRKSPLASEVLAALALSRGWVIHGGLPDETRTGRTILKDFVNGKLLSVSWPPGYSSNESASEDDATSQHSAEVRNQLSRHLVLSCYLLTNFGLKSLMKLIALFCSLKVGPLIESLMFPHLHL